MFISPSLAFEREPAVGGTAEAPESFPRLVLLAPTRTLPTEFTNISESFLSCSHDELLSQAQRLRWKAYAAEGVMSSADVTAGGRDVHALDEGAWHILLFSNSMRLLGTMRYHPNVGPADFLEGSENWDWYPQAHAAMRSCAHEAGQRGVPIAEAGGWVLSEEARKGSHSITLVAAVFGLAQALGGCVALAMARIGNNSAGMLRRSGARPLMHAGVAIPPLRHPSYGEATQILQFDSDSPTAQLRPAVQRAREYLWSSPVILPAAPHRA